MNHESTKTRTVVYVILAAAVLAGGGLSWRYMGSSAAPRSNTGIDGFPLVCVHCDHFFVVARDQIDSSPADPNGAGFKCEKCGKFGARVATQCRQCKQWFVAQARGAPCPHCSKNKPA